MSSGYFVCLLWTGKAWSAQHAKPHKYFLSHSFGDWLQSHGLSFHFLSPPLLLLFLPHFFSFAGHLVDFILVGKFFGKAFRIVGLDEREGRLRWVVKKVIFMEIFGSMLHGFCLFLLSLWLNHAHSGMVWKIFSPRTS